MQVRLQSGGVIDLEEYPFAKIEKYFSDQKDGRQYVCALALEKEPTIKTLERVTVGYYTSWADAEHVQDSLAEARRRGATFFDASSPSIP